MIAGRATISLVIFDLWNLPLLPIGFSELRALDVEQTLCLRGRTMLYCIEERNPNREIRVYTMVAPGLKAPTFRVAPNE